MSQENKVDSRQIAGLLDRQLIAWPLLKNNYALFEKVQIKKLSVGGVDIIVQFNPSRIVSAGAKVDAKSISERKCFLCPGNLPPEQEAVAFGSDYLVLCNPFPIFPQHFTVPTRRHVDQSILGRFEDMLDLTRALNSFTVFYNGPRSGASAPDHMHFQIVTRQYMPIDHLDITQLKRIHKGKETELYLLANYLRNGWVISSKDKSEALSCFTRLCQKTGTPAGEVEPMMNIFCNYHEGQWIIKVIPRKKHRPSQYFAEGDDKFLTSPGAADIGGAFITSREEDFNKVTPDLLRDIYEQVCFSNDEILVCL
ncbi:MAG: DUF4922 domain-containing protein [Tannerellaceae bacterium]|jgi:hypothetical protein|nr:DUF4922 domain-containing protein [Tannerellaceae bacterium]